jgi:hypothetical protein
VQSALQLLLCNSEKQQENEAGTIKIYSRANRSSNVT